MNNLDFRKNETMSGRKRRSEGQTPLLIDLTSDDEVSGGETAPESPAIQRSTRSGIIQTRRADYEPTNRKKPKILEKDTKNPQKLIQTKNNFENRLETKFENEFESESGFSKLKKSKSMKLWNGEKDAQEREKYERENSERAEIELIEYQRMKSLQNSTATRSLQEENLEFRRNMPMVGLRQNNPQNSSLFVKIEHPTRFSGESEENDKQSPDFSGGARNPFEVNYGYKWFENDIDGTKKVVRKCVKRVLEPDKDRKEIDTLAMERLDQDSAHVLRKVDTLMDNLTRPLEDAMAIYGELNKKYSAFTGWIFRPNRIFYFFPFSRLKISNLFLKLFIRRKK